MKISDVRIRLVNKEDNKLKAVASITIDDCFVIHDIKVIEATDGAFIAMPSRKTKFRLSTFPNSLFSATMGELSVRTTKTCLNLHR